MQIQGGILCLGKSEEKRILNPSFLLLFSLRKITQSKSNYLLYKNEMLVMPNILSLTVSVLILFFVRLAFSSPNYPKLMPFSTQSWMLCLSYLYSFFY
ncbi:hypothetical protein GQ55_4G137800 [Panicum hallii var. hallii]|uniref:Uncharacterized protein n=1 Tax=Panicum hallii var. hallii TaxID=1504633 RepID=A0A2T7DY69_9POAL|nr:hypothetical protein GQ55_4G137800 [Panicum hallii var. hallii]